MANKRNLIPNVVLKKHIFKLREKDFYKYVLPLATVLLVANMITIIGYSHYNLFLICGTILLVGGVLLAFYEIEYCYRVCDILLQYFKYKKRGDILYEKFEKEEEDRSI